MPFRKVKIGKENKYILDPVVIPKKMDPKKFHKLSTDLLNCGMEIEAYAEILDNPKYHSKLTDIEVENIGQLHAQKLQEFDNIFTYLQLHAANENLPIKEILDKLQKRKAKRAMIKKK